MATRPWAAAWLGLACLLMGASGLGHPPAAVAMVLHTKVGAPLGLSVGGKRLALGASAASWRQALGAPQSVVAMPAGQSAWGYPQRGLRVIVQNNEARGLGLVIDGRHVSLPPPRGTGKPLPAMLAGYQSARFLTDEGLGPLSTVAQVKATMGPTSFEDFAHAERMRQLHFARSFQGQEAGARVLFRYVQQKLVEVVLTRW